MARQTAPQKQLITLRQGVIILAIFVLCVFAFKYAQNVMRIRAAQSELASLEVAVDRVKAQQVAADEGFVNSISPGQVEKFAKGELGLARKDEVVYVPLLVGTANSEKGAVDNTGEKSDDSEKQPPPNWRQWLSLITTPDSE